jgi:hypothetical protein
VTSERHGVIEHDASLTRPDSAVGNNTVFDELIYIQMYQYVNPSKPSYMTSDSLASYRKFRQNQCKQLNPTGYSLPLKARFGASAEAAILFMEFKDPEVGEMYMPWVDIFFREERLPFELGWQTRSINMPEFTKLTLSMAFRSA